jgi:hypothetical protein
MNDRSRKKTTKSNNIHKLKRIDGIHRLATDWMLQPASIMQCSSGCRPDAGSWRVNGSAATILRMVNADAAPGNMLEAGTQKAARQHCAMLRRLQRPMPGGWRVNGSAATILRMVNADAAPGNMPEAGTQKAAR